MSLDVSQCVEGGAPVPWPEVDAPRLRVRLQRDLPTLSPKLRSVARFCIQHASTLHHCRIQDVAEACDTIPASVVRLAQRYGLRGFQDMKLAFLESQDREAIAPIGTGDSTLHPDCLAAMHDIDRSMRDLACLKGLAATPEFMHVASGLRTARHVRFDWTGDWDEAIATHFQTGLRAAGCDPIDTRRLDGASDDEWLVQVAVWSDLAPASIGRGVGFGPRVLTLAQGRMSRFATRGKGGTVVQVGTDARRNLMALALCDALAVAVNARARSRG